MRIDVYRLSDTADSLLAWLESVHAQDELAERKAKRYGVAALLCGIAAFVSLFLSALLGSAGALLAGLLLLATIVLAVLRLRSKVHDLDDRKLAAALRLLKVLRADLPSGERVQLLIDFRDYRKGGRLLARQGGLWSGTKQYKYLHDWLELRARLADGCGLVAVLGDRIGRKERSKRKGTRVAERIRSLVTVSLRLDKRYGDPAAVAQRLRGRTAEQGTRVVDTRARGRSLRVSLLTAGTRRVSYRGSTSLGAPELLGGGDTILKTLRFVYQGIGGARAA